MITNFNTNFLLVWIFRVNCGQSGHGQSGQTRNLMRKKVLKIVYINNIIIYIYYLQARKILSKIEFDHFDHDHFDHICIIFKVTMQSNRYHTRNSRFTYSTHTQQLTALFLAIFALFCLTSHSTNEQTAEKCIIFAPSTNESAQGASQEASITTKGGHNRRQAPVIY